MDAAGIGHPERLLSNHSGLVHKTAVGTLAQAGNAECATTSTVQQLC
jgi:hypothetical protein